METKEMNEFKEENGALNNTFKELSEDEFKEVSGGKSAAYYDCPQCGGEKTLRVVAARGHIQRLCMNCGYELMT